MIPIEVLVALAFDFISFTLIFHFETYSQQIVKETGDVNAMIEEMQRQIAKPRPYRFVVKKVDSDNTSKSTQN